MKRPGPPRSPGAAGPPPGDPDAQIVEARNALTRAAAEVERISRDRLTHLLEQDVRQRFRHFDDPDLVPSDRVRLRASVLDTARARGSRWASVVSGAEDVASRFVRHPKTIAAVLAVCFGVPTALHVMTRHDADRATVIRMTRVTTRNPDGSTTMVPLAPGARLVMSGEGPTLQARVWNTGVGYKIYDVDARDVARDHHSPWQAVTAFAAAVHAGWARPAARS
ncbi:hypothetical protein P7D22_08670 [Lichenihabitans sp. Uapishka_5]|uniref:hypothetical protein n=1 Tax=Lichenihabitans sp. Uapishka_5 TaxID=3037302 RepID=UPI0029E81B41|nr:hypothetical protein [Lichenihabitans sp. Uapishka_5]MDX7951249.1 hypothetical protein [Lichenihabitans sp. Uapishka_5]